MQQSVRQSSQSYQNTRYLPPPSSIPNTNQWHGSHSDVPSRPPSVSPAKRKANGDHAETPTTKRVQTVEQMNWSPSKTSGSLPSTLLKVPETSSIRTLHPNHTPYVHVPQPPSAFISPNAKMATPQKQELEQRYQQRYSTFATPSTPTTPTPRKARDDEYRPGYSDDEGLSSAPYPPSTQSRGGDRDERSKLTLP